MGEQRRIHYQLVAPMEKSLGADEIERRLSVLQAYAAPGNVVSIASTRRGTASIESSYDAALVTPYILESIDEAVDGGCDAVIVGCFSDPGLDAVRERARIPVVGPGMSAMHLALQLGDRFSIISPGETGSSRSASYVRQLGLQERYASTRGTGESVVDLARGNETTIERTAEVGRTCVEKDGADVLVLGCMSMAFLNVTSDLEDHIGVPVVSPVVAALKTAEMMMSHGVAHSATGWPRPPQKPVLTR